MNCPAEHSGCWYCLTDFDSPLGWWDSIEFDTVIHVECLEYEHNNKRTGDDMELDVFIKEFDYFEESQYKYWIDCKCEHCGEFYDNLDITIKYLDYKDSKYFLNGLGKKAECVSCDDGALLIVNRKSALIEDECIEE